MDNTRNKFTSHAEMKDDLNVFNNIIRNFDESRKDIKDISERYFLGAWLTGVAEVGKDFFDIDSDTELFKISDKSNATPKIDCALERLHELQPQYRILYILMCSFYDSNRIESYLTQYNITNFPSASERLTPLHRQIISTLFLYYKSWNTCDVIKIRKEISAV